MIIYHIVTPEVWKEFAGETEYEPESLAAEGFVHCSYRHQLEEVLRRYYADQKRVLILHVNPHRLTAPLVAEPSTNREIYPHIYGKINKSAIVEVEERNF